jgi:DNA-binding transcriptional LysR family regulator
MAPMPDMPAGLPVVFAPADARRHRQQPTGGVTHSTRDWLVKVRLVAAGCGLTTIPGSMLPVVPDGVRALPVRGARDPACADRPDARTASGGGARRRRRHPGCGRRIVGCRPRVRYMTARPPAWCRLARSCAAMT